MTLMTASKMPTQIESSNMNVKQCAAQHFGWWLCKTAWIESAVSSYNLKDLPKADRSVPTSWAGDPLYVDGAAPLFARTSDGIAVIDISGQMTKGQSSYGGTSNIMLRQALRTADRDPDIKGIMLAIDSPGGTVAGQLNLSTEIARIAKSSPKPIFAHAEDGMHSAALWAGTQAQVLTAGPMTEVGSIGTVATVHDTSKAAEDAGVKVHIISTGDLKGAFMPGTEITDEMLATVQTRVDDLNGFFLKAIQTGRRMSASAVKKLSTGEDWLSPQAAELGLIDGVMSDEQAMAGLRREIAKVSRQQDQARRLRNSKIRLASL